MKVAFKVLILFTLISMFGAMAWATCGTNPDVGIDQGKGAAAPVVGSANPAQGQGAVAGSAAGGAAVVKCQSPGVPAGCTP